MQSIRRHIRPLILYASSVPTVADDAFVIRVWDWSETSQTVSMFARTLGIFRGIAKGAKREKGRFSGGLELLTRGQIIAIRKPERDLATLTEWDLQEVFPRLRENLTAHYAGMYLADLTHHALVPDDPHEPLFDALLTSLRDISAGLDPLHATLRYQWTTLDECGYRPRLGAAALATGAHPAKPSAVLGFDASTGSLVRDPGATSSSRSSVWRIRSATADLLHLLDTDDQHSMTQRLIEDPASVHRCCRLLASYLSSVLGRETPSAAVLFDHAR